MNYRLQQFLSAENITQAQFADIIGVARASVSHILAGRNKPGFDFILGMARHYPDLNLEWLITGKGRMYKEGSAVNERPAPASEPSGLFVDDTVEQAEDSVVYEDAHSDINTSDTDINTVQQEVKQEVKTAFRPRSVSRIVVFYDDNTYQELL